MHLLIVIVIAAFNYGRYCNQNGNHNIQSARSSSPSSRHSLSLHWYIPSLLSSSFSSYACSFFHLIAVFIRLLHLSFIDLSFIHLFISAFVWVDVRMCECMNVEYESTHARWILYGSWCGDDSEAMCMLCCSVTASHCHCAHSQNDAHLSIEDEYTLFNWRIHQVYQRTFRCHVNECLRE